MPSNREFHDEKLMRKELITYRCHDGLGGQRKCHKIKNRAENDEGQAQKPKSAWWARKEVEYYARDDIVAVDAVTHVEYEYACIQIGMALARQIISVNVRLRAVAALLVEVLFLLLLHGAKFLNVDACCD